MRHGVNHAILRLKYMCDTRKDTEEMGLDAFTQES